MMIWLLRLSCFLQITAMGIPYVYDAVFMRDQGISESTIGLIIGFGNGLLIASALIWGKIVDRYNVYRLVIIAGTVGTVVALFYLSSAKSSSDFILYMGLKGILMPMILAVMPALVMSAVGDRKTGRNFGIYRAFGSIGFITGTMLFPYVLDDLVLTARLASLFLLSSLLPLYFLKNPHVEKADSMEPFRFFAQPIALKLYIFAFVLVAFAEPALYSFYSAYGRSLGASTRMLGILSGMMGIMALICMPILGTFLDKWGPILILRIAFIAIVLRAFIASLVTDANFLWIPNLLHGLAWGGLEIGSVIYLSRFVSQSQKASVMSLYFATRMTGNMLGAAMVGYLTESLGYLPTFRIMGGVALCGFFIFLFSGRFIVSDEKRTPELTAS